MALFFLRWSVASRRAALAQAVLLLQAPAWAQSGVPVSAAPSSGPTASQMLVVTGTREATPASQQTADVIVIDEATIRQSTADSLEDLLRREAGLQVSRNGGAGQTATLMVRGHSASALVVLVDGVRVGSATVGQVPFEMLPLAQIVRIEVLRGIASSLWGADAMGGVIHITTRHATREPRAGGQVTVGSLRSREADAWMTTRLGDVDLAASLSRSQSAGVSAVVAGDAFNPDRDGYARTAANVKAGWSLAPGHRLGAAFMQSRLASQYDGADYLPPTFAPDPSADFRHRARTQVASVDYRGRLSDIWTQSVQLARHDDNLRSGGGSVSRYTTQRNQFTWQHLLRPDARQQWVVAFERLGESVKADTFTANPSRVNLAGMAGLTWTQAGHTYQFDLRHDRNDAYGNSTTGRAGWRWALAPAWNVRASVGTAFRAPAFNETDYPGYGVATLQPERSTGWDAGVTWREGATSAGVTLFQNRVKQLIGYEPDATRCPADPAYSFGCAANIGRARLQGGTLTADHLWGNWSLGGTLDLLDARNLDTGERLVRRAAHQATLRAQWSQGPWASGLSLLRVGARPEGGATLDAYTTLDWFGRWRVAPGWQLEAKLTNLTDATVIPARDYQSPGRQAWLTLRYEGRGW